MAKNNGIPENRKTKVSLKNQTLDNTIRFIVPMPGRSNWSNMTYQTPYKKLQTFSDQSGDFPLEEYQAQFLMEREYIID
jgi:hypothetical protein